MDIKKILGAVDHTCLGVSAGEKEIRALCEDAARFRTASVCVAAANVELAREILAGRTAVCTVVGFPNGYSTATAKCFEAREAIANGADEIDTVINIGHLKDGKYDRVLDEIKAVKDACGDKILKVIVETCLLETHEKIRMCEIVTEAGADFIKTSTGFSKGGATFEDVQLFAKHIGDGVKIKAAGGISTLEDAERFLQLGASRLGTSRVVKIVKEMEIPGFRK